MKAVGTCPICKIELSVNDNIQQCKKCHREFYPVKDDDERLKYDDIETVSEDSNNEGPILLCEKSKESKPKDDYLKRIFGSHVTVETEIHIPE
jgi:hypothetical protein